MPLTEPRVATIEDIDMAYRALKDLAESYASFSLRPPFRFDVEATHHSKQDRPVRKWNPSSILASQLQWRRELALKVRKLQFDFSSVINNIRYSYFRLPVLPALGSYSTVRSCLDTVNQIGSQISIWFHDGYSELQSCGLKKDDFLCLCSGIWGRNQIESYPWKQLDDAIKFEHELLLYELQMFICDMQSRRLLMGVHRSSTGEEGKDEIEWTVEGGVASPLGIDRKISKQQLAKDLGMTANAFNHWMDEGILNPINPGGKSLVFKLEDAIAAATQKHKDVSKLVRRRRN